jgi:hypothetical protein
MITRSKRHTGNWLSFITLTRFVLPHYPYLSHPANRSKNRTKATKQQQTASKTSAKPTKPSPTLKSAPATTAAKTSSTPLSNSAAVAVSAVWVVVWVRKSTLKFCSRCLVGRWVEVALEAAVVVEVVVPVGSLVVSTLDEKRVESFLD